MVMVDGSYRPVATDYRADIMVMVSDGEWWPRPAAIVCPCMTHPEPLPQHLS